MAASRIQFRPGETLASELMERTMHAHYMDDAKRDNALAETVRQELNDYHLLMRLSLPTFSLAEAMCMVDVMNGRRLEPYTAPLLWANISDAMQMNGADKKWKVDGDVLVARLRDLGRSNPFACWAIADAIERAWNSETFQRANMEERVKQVGLVQNEKDRA